MVYVVAVGNWMVAVFRRFALVGSTTVPLLIVADPVLAAAAVACTAPAAAICDGLVTRTPKLPAACAVGRMRNWSPEAGVPDSTMDRPSAAMGLPAVPLPVNATALPSAAFVRE